MKKVLFTSMMVFAIAFSASSQTAKGSIALGASYSGHFYSGATLWNMSPSLSYFVKDNMAIGAGAEFVGKSGNTFTNISLFGKSYFGSSDKGKLYAKAGLGLCESEISYGAGFGYNAALGKALSVDLGIRYDKFGLSDGVIGAGVGLQFNLSK